MPSPRQSHALLSRAGRLVTIGGFAHTDGGGRSQADGFTFLGKENAWQPVAARLPEPRTQYGLVDAAGSTWVLGGIDYAPDRKGDEFRFPDAVLRWDGEGAFTAAAAMPRPRRAFGCAVVGERVWLVSGMRQGFEPVPEVDVFDAASASWSQGPAPAPRVSPFLFAIGDTLVLAGGSVAGDEGLAPATTLAVLPAGAARWHDVALPVDGPILGGVVWRERLLLASRSAQGLVLSAVQLPAEPARGD